MEGYTHEGLPVVKDEMVSLGFYPLTVQWQGFKPVVEVGLEFNKTQTGKRLPYICVGLFGLHIQSGWLF